MLTERRKVVSIYRIINPRFVDEPSFYMASVTVVALTKSDARRMLLHEGFRGKIEVFKRVRDVDPELGIVTWSYVDDCGRQVFRTGGRASVLGEIQATGPGR